MLIQSAINYNLHIKVLDPDENAPCRYIANEFTQGKLLDFDTVYEFGQDCDIITIEIEHVNIDALKRLEKEGKKVFPQPHVLETIQDKGTQKMFYQRNEIPSSSFFLAENKEQVERFRDYFPFFQKLRKGGYDGKGVVKLDNPDDLSKAFDAPSVLERLVDFQKEISVIIARNENGETKCFPVVECAFNPEANLVEFLFSPASIKKTEENEAYRIAALVADKMQIVGLLAVEMFVTKEGKVLVNEAAPRPHNSGHQTIEGNVTSQFEQHLRAILNLPLGDTSITRPSVMVNVLGEKGYEGDAQYVGIDRIMKWPGVHTHLYGKKTTKSFRKMGHVTVTAQTLEDAVKIAQGVKKTLKVIA
jgi:5-(carboxyamino)imidazole ribonucleotide synthase